jgi:hypothetical protein
MIGSVQICKSRLDLDRLKMPWMIAKDIVDYLEPSPGSFYRLEQGNIPMSKIGNRWRFNKDKIDHWMELQSIFKPSDKKIACQLQTSCTARLSQSVAKFELINQGRSVLAQLNTSSAPSSQLTL